MGRGGFETRPYECRIVVISVPSRRIVRDIFADLVQVVFVPDDVFIIVALPEMYAGGVPGNIHMA